MPVEGVPGSGSAQVRLVSSGAFVWRLTTWPVHTFPLLALGTHGLKGTAPDTGEPEQMSLHRTHWQGTQSPKCGFHSQQDKLRIKKGSSG